MPGSDRTYVACTVSRDREGRLRIVAEDDRGNRAEKWLSRSGRARSSRSRAHSVDALIRDAAALLRQAVPIYQRRTLPIFVSGDGIPMDDAVETCMHALRGSAPDSVLSWIRASPRPWTSRPSPSLPFRLALTARAARTVGRLPEHSWLSNQARAGVAVGVPLIRRSVEAFAGVLSENQPHVLVTLGEEDVPVETAIAKLPMDATPRIHVVLHSHARATKVPTRPPRDGVARVDAAGPPRAWARWLEILAEGFAHDLPLHDAVSAAQLAPHTRVTLPVRSVIWGDPGSIHGLRLADAIDGLIDVADGLRSVVRVPRRQFDTERKTSGGRALLLSDFSQAQLFLANITGSARESQGLQPATEWARHLERAQATRRRSATNRSTTARTVDLCFRRSISAALDRGALPQDLDALRVPRTSALEPGARYRLCLRIGHSFVDSLFDAPPPAIDPLLEKIDPRPERTVDVVLFPLDFVAEGAAIRRLPIPAFGPSATLSFGVRAPERRGQARLRVAVFLGNHLVQSYVVRALVGTRGEKKALGAELEFSRTNDIAVPGPLPDRAFAMLLNDDGDTHSFQFKMGGATATVRWSKKAVEASLRQIRQLLQELAVDKAPRRFPATGGTNPAAYAAALASLARLGESLLNHLVQENWDFSAMLPRIVSGKNLPLQAVFCDSDAEFPWGLLYDREPPVGAVRVCADFACTTDHGNAGFVCVAGFWGVRHVVEQLVAFGRETMGCVPGEQWPASAAVRVSLGVNDKAATSFVSDLASTLGNAAIGISPGTPPFLDGLWSATREPVNVVLGQVSPATSAGPAKITVNAQPPLHLFADEVIRRIRKAGHWLPPPGVVMLLGCRSGVTADFELIPLHRALLSAGAAAVVATECDVFSDVAALFGKEVVLGLGLKQAPGGTRLSMGEAVQKARVALLGLSNPLAFAFTAYGDASLRFA